MQQTKFIWQNGEYKLWDEAHVHALSHTLHYGSGAFEGIRVYQTKNGPAIFRLKEHIARLFYSAKTIDMQINYTKEQIAEIIVELVKKNGLQHGYIRPLFYYGAGGLGVIPVNNPTELVIACWPWGAYLAHEQIHVKVSKYIRIHPLSTVADAKLCGHYINSLLASLEIKGTKYHEVLMLDSDGYIAEGAGENLFLVKNNKLYTPALGSILPGITRDTVMQLARFYDIELIEKKLVLADVYAADEAFFTGTAVEVTAINTVEDKMIGKPGTSPITAFIQEKFHAAVRGEDKNFSSWLTYCE